MLRTLPIAVFTVLVSLTGLGANVYAGDILPVSNIGSSGEDGVDTASDSQLSL